LGPPVCTVEARKSNCAVQLESLRLLDSGNLQGATERVFSHDNVRPIKTQQKLTLAAMKFGIEPMLTGLFRRADQLLQNFQPGLGSPGLRIRHRHLHSPERFTKVAV